MAELVPPFVDMTTDGLLDTETFHDGFSSINLSELEVKGNQVYLFGLSLMICSASYPRVRGRDNDIVEGSLGCQ